MLTTACREWQRVGLHWDPLTEITAVHAFARAEDAEGAHPVMTEMLEVLVVAEILTEMGATVFDVSGEGAFVTTMPLVSVQAPYDLTRSLFRARVAPSRDGIPPSRAQVIALLEVAASVPDHGYVRPWRSVAVGESARGQFGDALAADAIAALSDPSVGERARQKAFAAPSLIVIVASLRPESPIPAWEQLVSAACTGYAIVLGAHTLGLGAIWKSTPFRDGSALREFCGCGADEQLLGWVLVGSPDEEARPKRRRRPPFDAASLVTIVE